MKKQGVWDEATRRYVYVRFMYGDPVKAIKTPNTEEEEQWSTRDVEEILREAFQMKKERP